MRRIGPIGWIRWIGPIFLALSLVGCGKVKSPTEPPPSGGGPAFTFSRIQAEIFTPTCDRSGCHAADTAQAGMVLQAGRSYGEIVGRRSTENPTLNRIEPGNPERSYMLKKLRGDPDITGEHMPLGGPYLTQDQIDGITGWILAGAPNN